MSDRLIIIGAGMAGLLAGNMMRRTPLQIVERQSKLPNNHHAVLRFRTTKVSEQLHVPFRPVQVFKSIDQLDPVRASMSYSHKVTGGYEVRSLIDLTPSQRYIAPPNLISLMAEGLDIAFGVDGLAYCAPEKRDEMGMSPIISTLPMGLLMDALEYDGPRPEFDFIKGYSVKAKILNCDYFATRYYSSPDPYKQLYRASITGDELILEYIGEPPFLLADTYNEVLPIAHDFGIVIEDIYDVVGPKPYKYAKIAKLSEEDRRHAMAFMHWATVNWQIFSLGRFAKWEAGLLLDDLVQDVLKIERWIKGSGYDIKKDMK